MNWSNVKLILAREIRDQLRDRRTLFMIAVLPLLLYPLLGMSFFQIAQFMKEQPTTILVLGAEGLEGLPPLIENNRFAGHLFEKPKRARLLELHFAAGEPRPDLPDVPDSISAARAAVQAGDYDAALYFPPDFGERLEAFRRAIEQQREHEFGFQVPSPEIIYTTASEESQIAFARLTIVLGRWTDRIGEKNLTAGGVPPTAARPFRLNSADLADQVGHRGLAMWSKILPVLLLLWALTGAFYPAVDLCAGEKERGTLETLLSSPAERSEIVVGKLLTIMLFSAATAVLNLASIGLTGKVILSQLPGLGPPPALAIVWLLLALVPVAALFSALCLALAAFARSTKEGQYYLMPLLLITMPLVILPMAPGVELNLGNSLIPVTGVVLLLRSALEGDYWQALQFLAPVLVVTVGCCLLAVRWAVDQFNAESVLFRESERLDLGLWLQHLLRDRRPTPTVAGAAFCGVVILVVKFFMSFALPAPSDFTDFAVLVAVSQLVVIATPAMLMTVMLTSSPRQTLLLRAAPTWTLLAAAFLALMLHPGVSALQVAVIRLYPISEELASISQLLGEAPSFGHLFFVIALLPAVCEELAFRGFILSGFRHLGHKWQAIVYTALFFGITHMIFQQSLIACLVGVVIGYLAVQAGSIWPCILFHVTHNTLGLATSHLTRDGLSRWSVPSWLVQAPDQGDFVYQWPLILLGSIAAAGVLFWFSRLPHPVTEEERLEEAIHHGSLDGVH